MLFRKLQPPSVERGPSLRICDGLDLAPAGTQTGEPYSHMYLEGTDACGKDTVADLMMGRDIDGVRVPARKAGAFFVDDTGRELKAWESEYPDKELFSGLLLAATVRDLSLAGLSRHLDLADYQASHNSIRGAAYQIAFGSNLSELFDETTDMLPPAYLPVALDTDLQVIGDRVLCDPNSTPFDYMVFEQPKKVEKMLDVITDRCRKLGGIVVDTSCKTPDEVADEIIDIRPPRFDQPTWEDPSYVVDKSADILGDLGKMHQYRTLAPIIDRVLGEIYAK